MALLQLVPTSGYRESHASGSVSTGDLRHSLLEEVYSKSEHLNLSNRWKRTNRQVQGKKSPGPVNQFSLEGNIFVLFLKCSEHINNIDCRNVFAL